VYKGDFKKYQMAMTLIATVRGIPQIYYGSEIGMSGDKTKVMLIFVKIFQEVGVMTLKMHL